MVGKSFPAPFAFRSFFSAVKFNHNQGFYHFDISTIYLVSLISLDFQIHRKRLLDLRFTSLNYCSLLLILVSMEHYWIFNFGFFGWASRKG